MGKSLADVLMGGFAAQICGCTILRVQHPQGAASSGCTILRVQQLSIFNVLAEGFKMAPSSLPNDRKWASHRPMCSWEVLLSKSVGAPSCADSQICALPYVINLQQSFIFRRNIVFYFDVCFKYIIFLTLNSICCVIACRMS